MILGSLAEASLGQAQDTDSLWTDEDAIERGDAGMEEPPVAGDDDPDSVDDDPYSMSAEESASLSSEHPSDPEADEPSDLDSEVFAVDPLVISYRPEDVFRLGGSAHLLDEEQLETFAYEDPNQILLQVPGLYVRQEDGFGLRPNIGLRGVSSDRSKKVTLMEDGILFGPAPYSAPAAYYFPLMPRVIGVEVFKGPAAILYGPNTIGGAINFLTRGVPEDNEGEIELSFGRFWSRRIHFHYGARAERVGFVVEGVDLGSQGYKEIDGSNDDTGFHRSEYALTGLVNSDPRRRVYHELELRLGYSRERSNETYLGLTDEDFRADPYRRYASTALARMTWWRTQVRLRHRIAIGDHVDLRTSLYRHDFDRTWRKVNRFRDGPELLDVLTNPTGRREIFYRVLTGESDSASVNDPLQDQQDLLVASNARRFVSEGVQTTLRADLETGEVSHDFEAGLRLHYDEIDRNHTEDGFRMQGGQLVRDGLDTSLTTDNEGRTLAFAAYFVYGLRYGGLTLTPGLRVEHIRTYFDDALADEELDEVATVWIPGAGASYEFIDNWAAFVGVHRGFSPVAPGQGEDVQPELSINYEAGVRYLDEQAGNLGEVTAFYNDYSNLIGECASSAGCPPELLDRQFNGGDVRVLGVEATAAYTFDIGRGIALPARLSYTFTHATFRTDFVSANPEFGDVSVGDEVPYIPMHQGRLQLGLQHEDWDVTTSLTYVGAMREEAAQGEVQPGELPKTDDYLLMDLAASYQAFDRVRLFFRMDNVLNSQPIVARRPFGARPTRPFSAQVGLRVSL